MSGRYVPAGSPDARLIGCSSDLGRLREKREKEESLKTMSSNGRSGVPRAMRIDFKKRDK